MKAMTTHEVRKTLGDCIDVCLWAGVNHAMPQGGASVISWQVVQAVDHVYAGVREHVLQLEIPNV